MTKDIVKEGFSEAQDSLREKQVNEVKQIVLKTLESIESLKKEKDKAQEAVKEIEEKIKILKMDIDDLKEGRLDRIEERQAKDEKAKATSVVIIIKEKEIIRECSPWYWPWRVVWQTPSVPLQCPSTWGNYSTVTPQLTIHNGSDSYAYYQSSSSSPEITCSIAKWATSGTYSLSDGKTVNIR